MVEENEAGELPAEDKAYFESRGEKLPEKPQEKTGEEKAETTSEAEAGVLGEETPAKKELVPLKTLLNEREEGKKTKTELQEIKTRFAVLEDRWNTLLTATAEPEKKVDADPEPDPNVDIFAHQAWMKRQVDGLKKAADDRIKADNQAKEETARETAVWNFWRESVRAAAETKTDFQDAVQFMSETRTKQLSALQGLNPQFQTPEGINHQIDSELKQIVIAASQSGISPADYIYDMAQKWGYKGPAPKADTAELETLAKNMEAETSLSGTGGSRPGGALDAKAIADMNADDFERWLTKAGPGGFKKLMQRGTA